MEASTICHWQCQCVVGGVGGGAEAGGGGGFNLHCGGDWFHWWWLHLWGPIDP